MAKLLSRHRTIAATSGVVAVIMMVGLSARTYVQADSETSHGPGGPVYVLPSAQELEDVRGVSIAEHEAAISATVQCLVARGFDSFATPGEGLRRSSLSAVVSDERIGEYNVAVGECSAETSLTAIELAVADAMDAASAEEKAAAAALLESCMAESAEDDPELAYFTCQQEVWAETGLIA